MCGPHQVWPLRSECCGRGVPTKVVCAECMKMCCLGGKNSVVKGLIHSPSIIIICFTQIVMNVAEIVMKLGDLGRRLGLLVSMLLELMSIASVNVVAAACFPVILCIDYCHCSALSCSKNYLWMTAQS